MRVVLTNWFLEKHTCSTAVRALTEAINNNQIFSFHSKHIDMRDHFDSTELRKELGIAQ